MSEPTPPREPPVADWAAVRALFDRLADLPPAGREAALADAEATEPVRAEVRSLLGHAEAGSGGFLASPLADEAPGRDGQRLGPWRIERLLGRGGMGEVWLARRDDGAWAGLAAIKVLRRGMDSDAVLARFAQEQQALARLSHPHIARLLDAGRTSDGLPYFVMEHVAGRPIDAACEGLPLAARIALFLQLADAVSFAHRNLLVHRDLKPGNVLVDAEGQVKLLDFGIAKALQADDAPELTQHGQMPFTPHYASPEQVRGEPVSTATDVYSLGVLLYTMLTGRRPYGRDADTAWEAARAVLEEAPTRPSALPPASAQDTAWATTRRRLRGDLDNILLKALDKAPERRYPTVDALGADLRAHLAGFPVSARRPSAPYLIGRFVRRHALPVALGAVAALGLVAATGVAVWQARVATAQREVAEQRFRQVRQLANQLVFKYHDEIENLPGATHAREALLTDAAAFLDSLDHDADDPKLAEELASTYYRIARLQGVDASINLGQHLASQRNLDKALALTRRYVDRPGTGTQSLAAAISMHVSQAELWQRSGRVTQADTTLREALPLLERALAIDPRDGWALASAITLHGVRARVLATHMAGATLGHWNEACASADRARAAADATLAADPENRYAPDSLAFTLGEQGNCRYLAGRQAEAVPLLTRQVALRDLMAVRFADDMDFRYQRAVARGQLARALSMAGRHAEAQPMVATALALARQAAAADAGNAAAAPRIEALEAIRLQVLAAAGARAEVRALAGRLQAPRPAADEDGFGTAALRAEALLWVARSERDERPATALALAGQAQALVQATAPGADNATGRWLLAQAEGERARALERLGRPGEATPAARRALALWHDGAPQEGVPPVFAPLIEPLRPLAAR